MSGRYNPNASRADNVWTFKGWLKLTPNQTPTFTAKKPTLQGNARAMFITVSVPDAVFRTPELKASISIPETTVSEFSIDVETASNALSKALGCDVQLDLKVGE